MTIELTTSQQKGVTITDRDLCVVAGPGSGKTRVLVERFSNLVIKHKVPINEILTLTFTEKAANEMKERAARSFEEKGMEKERQEIEFAYLSTIHGFCSRLLRENAIEAGIDPQFSVMDELNAGRIKEQALEDTLREQMDKKTLDTFLNNIYWKQTDPKKSRIKSFKENLIQLHEKIRNACVPITETIINDDLTQDIVNSYKIVESLINEIMTICSDKSLTPKTREKVDYILRNWSESDLQNDINILYGKIEKHTPLSLINKVKDIQNSITLTVSKDIKKPLSNLRAELNHLIGLLVEDYSTDIKMVLRDFIVKFDTVYLERKKNRGLIDFTDLEVEAIKLLEKNEHIANEIKRKFKYILVDEFQDISMLQKSLIDLIRSKNNLFIVGDAKQSIYGFRNADVEIFQNIQKNSNQASLISLNENFRSRPQILDFTNYIFNKLWPESSTREDNPDSISPPYEGGDKGVVGKQKACLPPGRRGNEEVVSYSSTNSTQQLKSGAKFSDKSLPSVEIIVAEGKDKAEARKWESMEIAKRIKEIVDNGEIRITNKWQSERSLTYRDFAILFRSTTDIKLYEHSLSHLDVPYYVVSGRGFFNTTEITDLINLLKVIESPLDEITLAAVLKSPFVGVDDDALYWMTDYVHNNNKKNFLYQSLDDVGSINNIETHSKSIIIQFTDFLKEVQEIKPRTSLWNLISFILKKTEFQSKILLFSNGKKRYANLLKLIELCKNQEDFEPLTLKDFIEIVENYKFREIRESEAPVESEEDDVVKLITTHSAKGLEFPVVIVADTDRSNSRPPDYFEFAKRHGISFKILNPSTNEAEVPLSYERINRETKDKELQESKRLLFVAMTRAQEHLIISGGINKNRSISSSDKGNWYNYISSSLDLDPDPENNREIIKLDDNKHGQNSSEIVEIRHTRVSEKNRPFTQSGPGKTEGVNKTNLLTQYAKEIATQDKINTPSTTKEIESAGKDILSTITHNVAFDNSHYVYSVTEILKFHFCPRLYYLNSILGLQGLCDQTLAEPNYEEGEDKSRLNDDEIPGHELGNIVHRVFKRYNYPEDNLKDCIKGELKIHSLDTNQKSINLITNWVNLFYTSKIGKEAASSKVHKRETSFIFNYRDNLIRGQIDLFYFDSRGALKIVDYKTNDITTDEVPEKVKLYQLQMQLYTRALETIYDKKVDESILYFLVPNKSVSIDTTENFELDLTLDNFFSAHKCRDFRKLSGQKCQWCEYNTVC